MRVKKSGVRSDGTRNSGVWDDGVRVGRVWHKQLRGDESVGKVLWVLRNDGDVMVCKENARV